MELSWKRRYRPARWRRSRFPFPFPLSLPSPPATPLSSVFLLLYGQVHRQNKLYEEKQPGTETSSPQSLRSARGGMRRSISPLRNSLRNFAMAPFLPGIVLGLELLLLRVLVLLLPASSVIPVRDWEIEAMGKMEIDAIVAEVLGRRARGKVSTVSESWLSGPSIRVSHRRTCR